MVKNVLMNKICKNLMLSSEPHAQECDPEFLSSAPRRGRRNER